MLKKITGSILTIMLALAGICAGLDSLDHSGEVYAESKTDIKTEIAAGDKVKMGKTGSSDIIWTVLHVDSNDKALLLSDTSLGSTTFGSSKSWSSSSAKNWCNQFYGGNTFTSKEKGYIKNVTVSSSIDGEFTDPGLSNEYIFFLSTKEWNDYRTTAKAPNIGPFWWLRSGHSSYADCAGCVDDQGRFRVGSISETLIARPAFYLNLTSEIPASYDSDTKTWTIKKDPVVTPPSSYNLTYDGTDQTLTTTGSTTGGTLYYALGENGETAPTDNWSTTVPAGKAAVTYYVWYKVTGDDQYDDVGPDCVEATIGKKELTVSGITASDKPYDGTVTAKLNTTGAQITGKFGDDDVEIDQISGVYTGENAKNVGTNKPIKVTVTLRGKDADNYEVTSGTDLTGAITARPLTVSGITASNKIYDGNTDADLTFTGAAFTGIIDGDSLSVEGKTTQKGSFDTKNAGTGKTVTLPELKLGGGSAGNYSIKDDSQTTATADITQKTITVSSGITSAGKIYDGKTTAPLDTGNAVLTGKVEGEDLSVTATGTFENKDVGTGKTITISGFELTGGEKGNYVLAGSGHQATTTGDITQKEAVLEWADTELTYDGKAQKPKASVSNLEDGDECTVTVDGEQTDANAKSGKDYYEAEAKALSNDNYKLPENVKAKFTIAPKELTQAMISLDSDTIKHDGSKKGPEVTMTDEDIMVKDEDYILSGDLSSSELGTHVITAEGKGNYTGSIETSWMMYSKKSNDQKEEGTGDRGDFEVFGDIESNTTDITVSNFTIDLAKGFLTEEDMARYNAGENVLVYMIIKEQPKSETGAGDRYILDQLFRETGATDISWYDITVWKKIGNSPATRVHDTGKEILMSVEVPDGQKNAPEGYTREFYMGRSHDGASKLLAQTSEVKVGFGSSKFSTYALAYKDTEKPKDDPGKGGKKGKGGANTGDPNDLAGFLALMLASGGALGAMGYRRRKER